MCGFDRRLLAFGCFAPEHPSVAFVARSFSQRLWDDGTIPVGRKCSDDPASFVVGFNDAEMERRHGCGR